MKPVLWLFCLGMLCFVGNDEAVRRGFIGEPIVQVLDLFDERPNYRVLIIGNSRTYYNNMPFMVRRIADSADAKYKLQVRMHALPAQSLEQHWNNPRVHELIEIGWDSIILQERSSGHINLRNQQSFSKYGRKLIEKAKNFAPKVSLFVGWPYSSTVFEGDKKQVKMHYMNMQQGHLMLSRETSTGLINVGSIWIRQLIRNSNLRLETDGNHPNFHGSYLAALAIYASLPGARIASVIYSPTSVAEPEATELRAAVERPSHF